MAAAPAIPLDPQPQERAWDADLVGWLPKARSDTWTTLNAAVLPVPCSCASDTAGAQRLTARGLSEHRHSSTSSPNLSVRDAQTPACACAAFRALSQHGGFQFPKLQNQAFRTSLRFSKCFNYKCDFEAWPHNDDTLSLGTPCSAPLCARVCVHVCLCLRVHVRLHVCAVCMCVPCVCAVCARVPTCAVCMCALCEHVCACVGKCACTYMCAM